MHANILLILFFSNTKSSPVPSQDSRVRVRFRVSIRCALQNLARSNKLSVYFLPTILNTMISDILLISNTVLHPTIQQGSMRLQMQPQSSSSRLYWFRMYTAVSLILLFFFFSMQASMCSLNLKLLLFLLYKNMVKSTMQVQIQHQSHVQSYSTYSIQYSLPLLDCRVWNTHYSYQFKLLIFLQNINCVQYKCCLHMTFLFTGFLEN